MKKQRKMNFCPKWGKGLNGHDIFCLKCGNNKLSAISIGRGISQNWIWVTVLAVALVGLVTAVVSPQRRIAPPLSADPIIHPRSLPLLRHLIVVAAGVTINWLIATSLPPKKPINISPMLWSKANIHEDR